MIPLLRLLFAPLLSLVFMILAAGLFNTFISVRLQMEGYGHQSVGVVTSALYLGILAGSIWIDRWISKTGHAKAIISFAFFLALLTLAQGIWINNWYWIFLRFLSGICTAGVFVVIESWLLLQGGPQFRGAVLSIYLTVFYAAQSAGQLLIKLSDPASFYPFLITTLLLLISALPVAFSQAAPPKQEHAVNMSLVELFRASPLGFAGGIISGILLAAVYGLVPVYANGVGMDVSQIGTLMAILIFGGFSLQLPMGKIGDRIDRRKVLNWASLFTTLLAVAIALFHDGPLYLLYLLVGLFGGFSFTLYPLSMAYACERVKEEQIVSATGGFVLSYGLGAIVGPLLAPIAMNHLGATGLFYFFGANSLLLALIGLKKPAPALLDE